LTPLAQVRLGSVDPKKPTAELLDVQGAPLGVVDGAVLEAQFTVANGYLIVTTDEDPYEGFLHFNLFDGEFRRIDAVGLGLAYHPGAFRMHRVGPADTLQFSFFADEVWQLEVAARGRLVLARAMVRSGIRRGSGGDTG
jgi:hypothetical protein